MYARSALADVLVRQRRFDEAETLYRNVLAGRRATLGEHSSSVASSTHDLGALAAARGDLTTTERLYRDAATRWRAADFPGDAFGDLTAAAAALARGHAEDAESLLAEALAIPLGGETSVRLGKAWLLRGRVAMARARRRRRASRRALRTRRRAAMK